MGTHRPTMVAAGTSRRASVANTRTMTLRSVPGASRPRVLDRMHGRSYTSRYIYLQHGQGKLIVSQSKLLIIIASSRRYCLALLCVTLSCGVLCDTYNTQLDGHSERAQAGGVWGQLGWPALPDFRRQVNTRPHYSYSRRLYAQRSFPTAGEASDQHARWASTRQALAPSQPRVQHHALADRYHAASSWTGHSLRPHQPTHTVHRLHQSNHTENRVAVSPAPTTRREDARPAAQLMSSPRTGRRRPGHQWLVPRRFLTSPDSGRGQGR